MVKGERKAKVSQENVRLVVPTPEHDVRRLDVAMNDILRVDVLKDVELAHSWTISQRSLFPNKLWPTICHTIAVRFRGVRGFFKEMNHVYRFGPNNSSER